jgi:hypothetical protein
MMRSETHSCPICGGAVNVEHYAVTRQPDREDRFLYCEFCERGFECSLYPDGDVLALDFVRRTEPVNFGKFLQRLEDARAA